MQMATRLQTNKKARGLITESLLIGESTCKQLLALLFNVPVMSRRSVNIDTLLLGRLRKAVNQYLVHITFASN